MAVPLFCFYKAKAPQGCLARGEEIRCFATPLAREEFVSELFNNRENNSVHSFLKSLYL